MKIAIRLLVLELLVLLPSMGLSQKITTQVNLNAGEIKQLHISKDGKLWVCTTDSKVVLWDHELKKVRWSRSHSNDVYQNKQSEIKFPSKAVVAGTSVYQVNTNSNSIEVRNTDDGEIVDNITLPQIRGKMALVSIIDIPNVSDQFFVAADLASNDQLDSLLNIGEARFLIKNLRAKRARFTPDGIYFSTEWSNFSSGFAKQSFNHQIFKFDPSYFSSPKKNLSQRFGEFRTFKTEVLLPSLDGKHMYRGRYLGEFNWKPKYALEKVFILTKKEIDHIILWQKPTLMDYFGQDNKLIMYTEKDHESKWYSVTPDDMFPLPIEIPISNPTGLFNDLTRNRLIVADKDGNLSILEKENPKGSITTYSVAGKVESTSETDLATSMAASRSAAEQAEAIKKIERDLTDPKADPDHYGNMAFDYSAKGMYAAAEAAQKRIFDAFPGDYIFTSYMAWFKLLNKKPTEAQKLALEAHKGLGFDAIAPTIISYTYAATQDMANAKKYMKTAVGNIIESKDLSDIESDVVTLKSIGYPVSAFDQLSKYQQTLYQYDVDKRTSIITNFQNAQREQNAPRRLSMLEGVIRSESALAAPRPELLGAAYSEAAKALRDKGDIQKSQSYSIKAVEILRPYGKLVLLTGALVGAGHAQNSGNKKDQAIKFYNEALQLINDYGGDLELYKNGALNGLGGAYNGIGEYDRAISYYELALKDARKTGRKNDEAIALGNIATVYIEEGNNVTNAINLLKQGEGIYRSLNDKRALATNYNNLGFGYLLLGQMNNAVQAFKEAERLYTLLGMRNGLANVNKNIGKMLMMLDQKIDAIKYYKKAAQHVNQDEDPSLAMSIYANLAGAELGQEQYVSAISHASQAITLNEKLLSDATGKTKRGLLSGTNNYYRIVSLAHSRSGAYNKAFEAHEKNRSRVMLDKLGGGPPIKATELQASLNDMEALIDYNVVHLHWEVNSHFFPIVIDKTTVQGREFSDSTLILDLKQEGEATFTAYMNGQRSMLKQIREFVEEKGVPDNVAQSFIRDSNLEKTIEFYRHLIKNPSVPNEVLRKSYARVFYDLLIGNIKNQIEGKTDLIIIPDGPLAFLPFETLIDENGQYLAEKYNIRYIQSATILNKLRQRKYTPDRKPLLAFGGPVFEEMSASEVNQYRGHQQSVDFNLLQRTYYAAEEIEGSMRPTYIQMGFTKMNPLPGTIYETNQIKGIVPETDLFQGEQASENQFKALANANKLKNYKVLHFATHGWAYGEIPELSTIVLGQYATPRGNEDGYLRVPEIEKLGLNADFVNLSACETALGRLYSSEGVVGLTQAFMVAGANGISVTQWTVSDEGTAIFMSEMYRKVFTKGQSFRNAISATKIEFIQGKYGEKFRHPDYWGPFVYYGI